MKHMNILCLILAMLLCAGCGALTIKGTVEPTARHAPPTQTIVPTPAATPEPEEELSHYIGFIGEPKEYQELREYLREFRFGEAFDSLKEYRFEPRSAQLRYPLWRIEAHQKPLKQGNFQIAAVILAPYNSDKPLPGTERSMGYMIEVRHVEKNPKYTEDNGEPYYIAGDNVERLACSYDILYYLNGYGITRSAYPTFSDNTAFFDYVQVDLDREIAGKKKKGEPLRVYKIYYVDYEAICVIERKDIDKASIGDFE